MISMSIFGNTPLTQNDQVWSEGRKEQGPGTTMESELVLGTSIEHKGDKFVLRSAKALTSEGETAKPKWFWSKNGALAAEALQGELFTVLKQTKAQVGAREFLSPLKNTSVQRGSSAPPPYVSWAQADIRKSAAEVDLSLIHI